MDHKLKTRPIFTCSTCGKNGCTLIVDTCEDLPKQCPFNPKVDQFADWFEMEIKTEYEPETKT